MNPMMTDSYKHTHAPLYPPGMTSIYSYFESRGGLFPETEFFGLQYPLIRYFLPRVTQYDIDEARKTLDAHFGGRVFNAAGWQHIVDVHGGRLPLRIKAVPEGTVVPTKNVLFTIENTCPNCAWLVSIAETLLVQMWYPITVASASRAIKQDLLVWLERTGTPEQIDFKLHDFGFRGASSSESAAWGGAAHLTNFKGTDTLAAVELARQFYGEECAGFSIPASEHSTICAWGEERECDAYENLLDRYPTGLVACVSDAYDIFRACSEYWGHRLREKVLARDGTLVVRPDSGDPVETVSKVVELLWAAFGGTTNVKGYKVLDPHVRVIQGDGVCRESINAILEELANRGFSTDNVAFGMGGALLQKWNRDDNKFALKCSHIVQNGVPVDVFKRPIGDASKVSKRGRLSLVTIPGRGYATVPETEEGDLLRTVFEDGDLFNLQSFDEIRKRAAVPVQLSLVAA